MTAYEPRLADTTTPPPTAPQAAALPLTFPQQGLWVLERLYPGTGLCNLAATMRIEDDLDHGLVNEAVNCMLRRNEGFRLRFREGTPGPDGEPGEPIQYVAPFHPYELETVDFRHVAPPTPDADEAARTAAGLSALYAWDAERTRVPFPTLDGDLYSFALVRIPPHATGFYVRCHHLIVDAWSMVQIANEIVEYYYLLKAGKPLPEEPNPSYADFVRAEQEYLASPRFEADRAYWNERYACPPDPTVLRKRPAGRAGISAKRRTFLLPEKLVRKIKAHCAERRTSVFALYYAAFALYVNRTQGVREVVFGTPVLNRTNVREKRTIGMFISTVPLRTCIDPDQPFQEFAHAVDSEWFSVLKHQKYPYDALLQDVRARRRDLDRLYDVAISYQNAKMVKGDAEGGERPREESRWHFGGMQVESLYIHLNDREDDGRLVVNYDYLTDLFYAKEIDFLHEHVVQLLWHALDNPARRVGEIHMLSEAERRRVVETFNATDCVYPETTVGALFAAQAARTPDAPAIIHSGRTLSYREADAKANRLANRLRALGAGPGDRVALLLPRSAEMVLGILGVVKSGAAYVPIDPDYPEERIAYLLQDCAPAALVTCADALLESPCTPDGSAASGYEGPVLDLFALLDAAPGPDDAETPPPDRSGPDDLLYVIYTSGTTGRSKGALITHRNVVRLLFNDRFPYDFGPDDRWSLFHSYCFDFSVWEMYGALLYGGALVVVPRDVARSTDRFLSLLVRERVTILNQTPAAFYNLVESVVRTKETGLAVRTVVFGGDALKPLLLKPFRALYPATRLVNMYGITETTVHVTYLELSDADLDKPVSNIGKPIPGMRCYVLDERLNPQPIGVPGELCVAGDGVGLGYLNRPELTAEKFVPDPFRPGGLLYRSGDLARFFPQGDLEYLGRIDTQVKIRGHRIELGEVESAVLRSGLAAQAAVVAFSAGDVPTASAAEADAASDAAPAPGSGESRRLCAYCVPADPGAPLDVASLRAFLARTLPEYMVPSHIVAVPDLPLNSNGKIDRARLPAPDASSAAASAYVAPRSELEGRIAAVWRDALKLPRIGIHDDFWQSGGDSLNAVVVISRLEGRASFGDLYRHPTVARLAEAIARKETDGTHDQLLMKLAGEEGADRTHLVCFPYGGGSGVVFKDLADAVVRRAPDYCVYSVDLPGRIGGFSRHLKDNAVLAAQLVEEIKGTFTGDIVVYGHCVGNALAFETTKLLRAQGIRVRGFYAGAILPPPDPHRIPENHDPWADVPDRGILLLLHNLGLECIPRGKGSGRESCDVLLPAFRHDVRSYYRFFRERSVSASEESSQAVLDIPVVGVFGGTDPFTFRHRRRFRRWTRYAVDARRIVIPGASHYFLKTHAERLAEILTGGRTDPC